MEGTYEGMASLLYRLGALAARRGLAVIAIWALLLAGVAAAAFSLHKPFTSKLTIPGTEFQAVLDDLARTVPEASGGTTTVVFSTQDGRAFTAQQQQAVADVAGRWEGMEQVRSVVEPFSTQAQIEAGAQKIKDARQELSDGRATLKDKEAELAEGKTKLKDGRAESTEGQAKLERGRAALQAGAGRLSAGERQLAAGKAELEARARQLAEGERKLNAGAQRLAAAKKELTAGQAALAQAKKTLPGQLTALEQQRTQAEAGVAQLTQALRPYAASQRNLQGQLAEVAAKEQAGTLTAAEAEKQRLTINAQLAALKRQYAPLVAEKQAAEQGLAKLDAGIAKVKKAIASLPAQAQQLKTGADTLAAQEKALAANRHKLAAGKAQLEAGRRTLAAKTAELRQGQATLVSKRRELAAGQAKLDAGRAAIAEAAQKLEAGTIQLDEARDKLVQGEEELAAGERRAALTDGMRVVSQNQSVAMSRVTFLTGLHSVEPAVKQEFQRLAEPLATQNIIVSYAAEMQDHTNFAGPGEIIGFAVAGLVLLIMLGSLLAAGLPLFTALIGVGVGLLSVMVLTQWIDMNTVTPSLALMLGLAVGIDYALFIVHRHREQLVKGMELRHSIALATGTAGNAVVFAGITVIVALAALTLTGIPFLGVMGLAAAGTVLTAVVLSVTLTPALLSVIGPRILSSKARRRMREQMASDAAEAAQEDRADHAHGQITHPRGHGWGGLVTRHPWATLLASTVLLGVLTIPAADLRLGLPDGSSEPADSSAYRAYSLVEQNFGAGQNGPILAVATATPDKATSLDEAGASQLEVQLAEQLGAIQGVQRVIPATHSSDLRTFVFQLIPASGPTHPDTAHLVHTLREQRDGIGQPLGIQSIGLAGQTVANIDVSERLASALPLYLCVVVGISLLLLLLVFRSLLVPLIATAGFLLSVGAAFGCVVAVYQWGWLGPIFAVDNPGVILSFLPTLAIGILFGLAMDYQMFLVTGMREAWAHGHTARTAVRHGFNHGARVVTAAALIMASVFASFIYAENTMVRAIGFSLAVGVVLDAFVVRMTAMPALMHLLGEHAWALPRWLSRILPDLDVEGATLTRQNPAEAEMPVVTEGASTSPPVPEQPVSSR